MNSRTRALLPLRVKPPPAASLIRPPRRSGRLVLVSVLLGLVGLAGGLTLGLGLRPAPVVSTPVSPPSTTPTAETEAAGSLRAEVARLRAAREEDQARLGSLAQAQATAEAELSNLRRDLASARREPPPPPPAPSAQITASPLPPPRPARAEPSPPSGQPRVFIHLRAGSNAAADAAASLVQPLREAGFELGEMRQVTSTPSQRVVRYFHGEDAAAAARLAGRLGRGWAIQDFRGYEPAPAPQTLEIWLPDR